MTLIVRNEMSQFEKCCWQWVKRDSFIYKVVKDDERVITVKFEDIFDKSNHELWNILSFLEIDMNREKFNRICEKFMNKKINKSKRYTFPYWKKWDISLREKFVNIAGQHMKNYNYNIKDFV